MPDLITHTAVAHLLRRPFERPSDPDAGATRTLFYLGTILPDILTRPWYILIPATHDWTMAFHTPVGALLACGLLALLFEPPLRKKAFLWLGGGSLLHFFLDGFQKQVVGNSTWLFPLTWNDYGYGIAWSGEIMRLIPLWLALVVVMEIILFLRRKKVR